MKKIDNSEELVPYAGNYTESSFQEKLLSVARKAGKKVVYAALLLYYALQDNRVPSKEKMIIIGALGYFILPTDLIMDFIPFAGYTDDFIALAFAVKTIHNSITPDIKQRAKAKTEEFFGSLRDDDLNLSEES